MRDQVEMVDLSLEIGGGPLTASHPFEVWEVLAGIAPGLAEASGRDERIGMLPIKLADETSGLLSRRARLVLRLPPFLATALANELVERELQLPGATIRLGKAKIRAISPYPTMHAHLVATEEDELTFIESVRAHLANSGIACNLICGLARSIGDGKHSIRGYSLVVHDLKADASLKLQYTGLGGNRRHGCGIFMPYKQISGLDEDGF